MSDDHPEHIQQIAILGGAGRIGAWFVKYFINKKFNVVLTDIREEEARSVALETGATLAKDNLEAVRDADIVLLCVPMVVIPGLILEVAPNMKEGSVLGEVSSIKSRAVEALHKVPSHGVKPLSIHPMFGPSAESVKGKTLVVVPIHDEDFEVGLVHKIFGGSNIVVTSSEEHDRGMAVNLSLTYLLNLALGEAMKKEDIRFLKSLAGTTFTVQLAVLEGVVSEDPKLIQSLLIENKYTPEYLDRYLSAVKEIGDMVRTDEGFHDYLSSLRDYLKGDEDFSLADERRYKAFKALSE